MVASEWRGSYYQRKEDSSWRSRQTGNVVQNVRLKKRKGKTNQAVIFDGKNFLGQEMNRHHFFGADPKLTKTNKKAFEQRVRSKAELRAIHAKKRR